jgi:hypothetical protein
MPIRVRGLLERFAQQRAPRYARQGTQGAQPVASAGGPIAISKIRFARAPRRQLAKVYGRIGDLEVRLALTRADIKLAQRLRYDVFYGEMSAKPSITALMRRRDEVLRPSLIVVGTACGSRG